ncbi:MAG: hypothetical protein DSZ11_03470 [Sulfurovum sp.]|nr:MAG: hypothetical protein DSZ11_03470 [Sulfurovum sp.]
MSQVYSLKCPNCAGALNLLGGGRVQTTTCPYCKSVIDLNDNYKVLYNFKNSVVPKVPFKLGMRGEVEGVEWTIIGWIVYCGEYDSNDMWSEFLLFSPFYGYGWLIYEEGEIGFSKRVRDFNLQKWDKNSSTVFYQKGHYLLQNEPYKASIYFVQGELTWVAKKNDKTRYWDYKKTFKDSLNIEQSNQEIEVYHTKRVKAQEIYESFGVEEEQQIIKKRTISEKIEEELEEKKPISLYGIIAITLTLLILLLLSSITSNTILNKNIHGDVEYGFKVQSSAFLNQITIKSSSNSILNSYEFSLFKGKKKIFYINKYKVYFSKQYLGKTWSHASIGSKIYLRLDKGEYLLKAKKITKVATLTPTLIKIEERVIRNAYFLPLFTVMVLFLLYFIFKQQKFIYPIAFGLILLGIFGLTSLFFIGLGVLSIAYFRKGSRND